jgi:biotin carboxyl carrier protein
VVSASRLGTLIVAGRTIVLRHADRSYEVTIAEDGQVRVNGDLVAVSLEGDGSVRAGAGGAVIWIAAAGDVRWVFTDGRVYELEAERAGRRRRAASHHASLTAPMPSTVLRINVSAGDRVERNATLIVLEAMKMELPVKAGSAAVVQAINCRAGELVQPGAVLIELDEVEHG